MLDLGIVKPGSKIFFPANTFDSNDPAASVTASTWANTDCHIHKDGGTTQRASSSGETLSIDFDGIAGNHLLEIDLADNTTANFYEAGSTYHVRIEGVTVDGGNLNVWIGSFTIGYPGAVLDTTIATLASQTSFTLEEGSADDDAYIGCPVYIHDLASAVQVAFGYVSDYTGSSKTITLAADPGIFTMAAGDSISFFPPANVQAVAGTAQTAGDVSALISALNNISNANVLTQINAALDTAISELAVAAPTATPTLRTGLMLLYMALRNQTIVQTSGTDALEIHNDAGTKIASKALTDDGSDYTEGQMS